jgi:hypothetical protein
MGMDEYDKDTTDYTYIGDDILIEEMPQGCIISRKIGGYQATVIVSSKRDAESLINSLQELLKSTQ